MIDNLPPWPTGWVLFGALAAAAAIGMVLWLS